MYYGLTWSFQKVYTVQTLLIVRRKSLVLGTRYQGTSKFFCSFPIPIGQFLSHASVVSGFFRFFCFFLRRPSFSIFFFKLLPIFSFLGSFVVVSQFPLQHGITSHRSNKFTDIHYISLHTNSIISIPWHYDFLLLPQPQQLPRSNLWVAWYKTFRFLWDKRRTAYVSHFGVLKSWLFCRLTFF